MSRNPWKFKKIDYNYSSIEIILYKNDIRGGFDLGRVKEQKFIVIENIDFKNKDKEYWKNIFNTIHIAGKEWDVKIPHKDAVKMIKLIRKMRYQNNIPRAKTWEERYGTAVANWAIKIIETEIDDYCRDNYRLARKDDKRALYRYNLAKKHGCCGFFDVVRRCPYDWFREYYIGCNYYGH